MGQKVHPLGFRVGITKKHQSQWFARFNKHKYAQSVLEDRMLRQTLTSLFPQLLNPVLKKVQKRDEETSIVPKITQIKIERGLIPYEIGIQIHAENCDLIKSSIENLKMNRDLVCKLQKTRRYLQQLRLKLNDFETISDSYTQASTGGVNTTKTAAASENVRFRRKPRLTKQQLRRQRLILKRLKKRESIRRRYKQLVYKGLFLSKKGNTVVQKIVNAKKVNKKSTRLNASLSKVATTHKNAGANIFKSRIKKKFVSIFINRMNKTFLQALKESLKTAASQPVEQLGWSKKWNFNAVWSKKQMGLKSLSQLNHLIFILEQKALKKMEVLRKDFIAVGSISKAASFNYYQMLMFLKQLKEHVSFMKRNQKFQVTLNKFNTVNSGKSILDLTSDNSQDSLKMTVLARKLNNIENECRKVKFIEYLKQLVKKHRTENLYLYLASIGEARRDLRKLKQFTKRHASFLFGLNLANTQQATDSTDSLAQKVKERVSNVLEKSSSKNDSEKTLQDIFLEQIEKQRIMHQDNIQLTPKIAIKFYAVNPQTLKAKASVVADAVVDALEKRKAFRKVIKDAKENLMRTAGVKGVKIQVSGRLNGAEIARSEWVRAGRVPLQTLRANLDYAYKTANTIYGIVGVKVWIFKGYTKFI
jgi:ribosomal protein S3